MVVYHLLPLLLKKGHLVGVVGKVGSGKTSVIAALTAEMLKKTGTVFVSGREGGLGLVTQVSSLGGMLVGPVMSSVVATFYHQLSEILDSACHSEGQHSLWP